MCKGTQSSIHFLWGAMLSFRAVQQSIQQPNVLPAIASCVCVCFLFLSLNFVLVKGRHRNARSQIPLAAMTNNQWNQLRNAKWQQTCVFVCVIPLQTIFTLKALPEKTMNLLSHPTIKDVHHYRIVSMRSLVPQTYNKFETSHQWRSWPSHPGGFEIHEILETHPAQNITISAYLYSRFFRSWPVWWVLSDLFSDLYLGNQNVTWKKLVHGFTHHGSYFLWSYFFWELYLPKTHTEHADSCHNLSPEKNNRMFRTPWSFHRSDWQ